MGRALFILGFCWTFLCWAPLARRTALSASPQRAWNSSYYYVCKGDTLRVVDGDPARTDYTAWQVWVYPQSVRLSRPGAGLAYVRWGVIQAASASSVMGQLAAYQQFERAYRDYFGSNGWTHFAFSNGLGPIAVAEPRPADDLRFEIDQLNQRLASVVAELRPSLVNADHNQVSGQVQLCFEQVRSSMQDVARFYDKLSRLPTERIYLSQLLARLTPGVNQAENAVPIVRRILPTVKLPVNKDWMTHTEPAGAEGMVDVTVTELGSSAWVRQSWTGGDGSMTGAKFITIVPYQDIGSVDIEFSPFGDDQRWIVRIRPADPNGFPQTVTSPQRITRKHTYPAVNLKTTEGFLYLQFSDPRKAQDAYAFFLYHKQRGI
jgi:hypothetical protein